MSVIKWEPFNEIERRFDDRFFSSFPKLGFDLSVDVYEEGGDIVAKMSLPGVKATEVEVSIDDDVLSVTGEREEENETSKREYYSKEIRRGSFSRTTKLPVIVEGAKSAAKFENGLLVVTMPIKKNGKQHAVKVRIDE